MNVRFYGANAGSGTTALLQELNGGEPLTLRPVDVYTRHHREQLLGARLVVRSGVLGVNDDGLQLYHELANEDTGALAATFVHRLRPVDHSGARSRLPDAVVEAARESLVTVPPFGMPRSIALDADPAAVAPGLELLRDRDLAMRKVRSVTPEECDEHGDFIWFYAPGLTWGGEPLDGSMSSLFHEGPNGERMGWASMETRMVVGRLPRVGDRIQSFSAVIGLRDKTSHRIQWAYDIEREDLLVTFEVVNLAFDVARRAPMSIPDPIREFEQAALHDDLAPR